MLSPLGRSRAGALLPAPVAAAIFVAGIAVSWRRLGNLTIDTGRELTVPLRLAAGERLYADVAWYWGPLAPELNALLYRAFGVHADVLMWAGIVSAALLAIALWLIARMFVRPWVVSAGVAAFSWTCAFADAQAAVFNFVLPFNYSATYGIVAATWSVVLLLWFVRRRTAGLLVGSGLLGAVAMLAKLEVTLPVLVAHAAFVVLDRRRLGRVHMIAYALAISVVAGAYGLFYVKIGPELWANNLAILVGPKSEHYIRHGMGTDDYLASGLDAAVSVAAFSLLLGLCFLLVRLVEPGRGRARARWIAGAFIVVTTFVLSALANPAFSLRVTPFVLAAAALVAAWNARSARSPLRRTRELQEAILLLFTAALLPRIALQVGPHGYGFYLLGPGLIGLGVVLCRHVPRVVRARTTGRRFVHAAVAAALFGLAASGLRVSWPQLHDNRVLVESPRAALHVGVPEREALRMLTGFDRSTRALALPDASGLVFASGLWPAKTPVLTYVPMSIPDDETEMAILRSLANDPPDLVVWSDQRAESRRTFGVAPLGVGYGVRIREWLEANYVPLNSPVSFYVFLVPRRAATRSP